MKCGICRSRMSVLAGSVEVSLYSREDFDPEDSQPTSVEDFDLCEKCLSILSHRTVASLIRRAVRS